MQYRDKSPSDLERNNWYNQSELPSIDLTVLKASQRPVIFFSTEFRGRCLRDGPGSPVDLPTTTTNLAIIL